MSSGQQPADAYRLPADKLAQAVALDKIRTLLHFGSEFSELAVLVLLLATGCAARLGNWVSRRTGRGWLQSGMFGVLVGMLVFLTADLPLSAIGHAFSLHYGISVENWGDWLIDTGKALGLSLLGESLLVMLAYTLLRRSPRRYWLWFGLAMIPLTVLGAYVLPTLIEPIFNSYQPLAQSHPALARDLERVVAHTGVSIPPERMFVMKASDKSNGLNAYVTGLGSTRRIVIWDTTADRMPPDEILFTFAHESGHYVLNHIPRGLALGAVGMIALFWITAGAAEWMVRRFGAAWNVPALASLPGLVVLLLTLAALQIAIEPIESAASRYIEHQADVYGQEAIHGIVADPQRTAVAAFNRLGAAYLDDPHPNPLVVFWSYDHPSMQSRATFAAQYDPWTPGGRPRFFPR